MAKSRRNAWKPNHEDLRTRVLAVDDEFHIRFLLKEALPKKSYEVLMAGSGEEALGILADKPIDIAIVDINMPVMSGLELTSRIHEEYPRVQVILMTGKPDAYAAVACAKMDPADMLMKPITRDRLLNSVELAKKAKERPTRAPSPTRGASMTVVLAEDIANLEPSGRVPPDPRRPAPKIPAESSREELSTALSEPAPAPVRQKPRKATAAGATGNKHGAREGFDPDDTSRLDDASERTIGGYKVIKPLAVSDFGVVFLVEKRNGDNWQRFGMKVISFDSKDPRTPGKVEHLLNETKIVGAIDHPNIVKPVAVGIDENSKVPFIVYNFVQGCPLSVLMPENMLDFYLRVRVLAQTASALAAMHARKLCHRTLKPENIILDNEAHVQLLDFGFASIPISNLDVQSILHRLSYHAPETLTESQVIPKSDVYTLAVVGYSLFMGANPFEFDSPQAVTHAIHSLNPPTLAKSIPDFPQDLSALIDCALSKDPTHRPTSAELSGKLAEIHERMEPRTDIPLPAYKVSET
jgi:CheY-like chemotaxis protein